MSKLIWKFCKALHPHSQSEWGARNTTAPGGRYRERELAQWSKKSSKWAMRGFLWVPQEGRDQKLWFNRCGINRDEVVYVIRHKTECNRNEIMNVINSKKTHKITYIVNDDIHTKAWLHTNPSDWITSYACLVGSSLANSLQLGRTMVEGSSSCW